MSSVRSRAVMYFRNPSAVFPGAHTHGKPRMSPSMLSALSPYTISFEQRRQRLLSKDIAALVRRNVADGSRGGRCDGLSETVSRSCQNVEET
jgi:hypothetical protein